MGGILLCNEKLKFANILYLWIQPVIDQWIQLNIRSIFSKSKSLNKIKSDPDSQKNLIFLGQLPGYVSELQVHINKIDDFGAITAYKTMIFQNIQYNLVLSFRPLSGISKMI